MTHEVGQTCAFACLCCCCLVCVIVLVSGAHGGRPAGGRDTCFVPRALYTDNASVGVSVAASCTGQRVAVATTSGAVYAWLLDEATGVYTARARQTIVPPGADAQSVALSCSGRTLAVGLGNGSALVFTLGPAHALAAAHNGTKTARAVRLSCRGDVLLTVPLLDGGLVYVGNASAGDLTAGPRVEPGPVGAAVTCAGTHVALAQAGVVRVYAVPSWRLTASIDDGTLGSGPLSVSTAGHAADVLAVGVVNASGVKVFVRNGTTYTAVAAVRQPGQPGFARVVTLDWAARNLAVAAADNVTVWQWNTLLARFTLMHGLPVAGTGADAVLSHDGTVTLTTGHTPAYVACAGKTGSGVCPPC